MAVATRVVEKTRGKTERAGTLREGRGWRFRVGGSGATGGFPSTTWTIPAEKFDEQVPEMVEGKFR